ncbi:MAG: RNA polymerase sporulation sigma factor SigK [Eubacteriales bacterium]|nr:RNA polymerase sporulation sigma factor SigK [Eubacteriales bacterium]
MVEGFFLLLKNLMICSSYVDSKNSFPKPLSSEKERYYVLRANEGDQEAKDILIKHNLRLVAHIAKKYSNYPDNDELISVGSIGLIKAVNTYNLEKGTGLVTYAARCIENEILMLIRSSKKHRGNVSLYSTVGVDKEGNEMSLEDTLQSDESVIIDTENKIIMENIVAIMKKTLNEREYEIISLRYPLDRKGLTQKEVAKAYGISRSYVSRIEKKALEKVREEVEKQEIYI